MTIGELAKLFDSERHINAPADGDPDAGMVPGRLVRFDWIDVDQRFAEYAELERSYALSRRGID